jgi:N-acyl-D-amino-acid deacylase
VADRATFQDPVQHPVGIRDVLVGGELVVREGEPTGAGAGRVVA